MTRNVAIACQGGGSHTAFTGGVLSALVPAVTTDPDQTLVALSGTSGGAISAAVAWNALLSDGPKRVSVAIESVWADLAAHEPWDRLANDWLVGIARLADSGFPSPSLSPYHSPLARQGLRQFRETLNRHINFDNFHTLITDDSPDLIVGTVDVNGGLFEAFRNDDVTAEVLLASATVPELFPAVEMNGHAHWDGIFSQNPPIHELYSVPPARKPDDLWVVQINPQTRDEVPQTLPEIADRRNELAGNISLNQELRFVETVNDWLDAGRLADEQFTHTRVQRLQLGRSMEAASKIDRDPELIEDLLRSGRKRGRMFLTDD